jgi:DNA mismatch repair ATPase MutS
MLLWPLCCREAVAAVAQLDALQSLASLAALPGYCRHPYAVTFMSLQKSYFSHAALALCCREAVAAVAQLDALQSLASLAASPGYCRHIYLNRQVYKFHLLLLFWRLCREAVAAVAQLDALQSLASLAASPGYCRPHFLDDSQPQQLLLVDGKHPMLDLALDGAAVGNRLELKWDGVRAAVVTG